MRHMLCLTLLVAVLGWMSPAAGATIYNVGPGQTYANIGNVPWESLVAGDTVNIYYRSTPYYEKWDMAVVGTAVNPVLVHGVPDPGTGALPIIDGQNATTRSQLNFGSEPRGLVDIQYGTTQPPSCHSAYITIENLEMRNASTPYSFTGHAGTVQNWVGMSAAIWIVDGLNITVRNCYIHDCGNGIMTYCTDTGNYWTQDFLFEGNYFNNCGNAGSTTEHSMYGETYRLTYQYNYCGPVRGTFTGQSTGENILDRGCCTVRYNWIDGGNRCLDLSDAQDSRTLGAEPEWSKAMVYGNVMIKENDSTNNQLVHFGQDRHTTARVNGYFYNNTMISLRTGTLIIFMNTGTGFIDCRNNVINMTGAGSTCTIADASTAPVNMTHNWLKPGYVLVGSKGTVNDDGTSVTGPSAGFVNESGQDYHLASGSQCINAATTLHADCASYPVTMQYLAPHGGQTRPNGSYDIGAFGFAGGGLAITTSSLPAGTIGAAYSQTLAASGGTTPYTWSVSSGSLPGGLTLGASSGAITGTPTATGTSSFTAKVTDNVGATATKALSITINSVAPLTITTTSLPGGHKGQAYSATLAATGGMTPYSWSIASGSLPAGLSLTGSSGLISGTPTVSGTSSFTAKVTDNVSATATKALSIAVARK